MLERYEEARKKWLPTTTAEELSPTGEHGEENQDPAEKKKAPLWKRALTKLLINLIRLGFVFLFLFLVDKIVYIWH